MWSSKHQSCPLRPFTQDFRVQRVVQPFLPAVPSMIDIHHLLTALSPTQPTFPRHVYDYTRMHVCRYACMNLFIQSFTYKSMYVFFLARSVTCYPYPHCFPRPSSASSPPSFHYIYTLVFFYSLFINLCQFSCCC